MPFERIENHELENKLGYYMANNPVTCTEPNVGGRCVLHPGDGVRIESVWRRNAYPGDEMVLLYVHGFVTDLHTHIPTDMFFEHYIGVFKYSLVPQPGHSR